MSRAHILLAIAVAGLAAGVAVPGGANARRRIALQSAADEVRSILLTARVRATERDRGVAVRFVQIDGAWHHVMYDDGDGDGVRREDIAQGIDPPAAPPLPVLRPGAVRITQVNDPALCVFAPNGSSSPCVIAIAGDGGSVAYVTQRGLS